MPEVEELERRLADYEALLEIGVELASTLELSRVLSLALAKAEELCRCETGSIWELDRERGELFFRVVRGSAANDISDLRVPLGRGIVGAVATSGEPALVADVTADPRWRGELVPTFTTRSILAVPLAAHGEVIGVLQLLNPIGRDGFDAGDLRRMQLFAGPLAHALDNARLYAAQQRQFLDTVTALAEAIEKRDPYTGGHVRRVVALSLLLGRELGLSRRQLERLRLGATLHDVGKIGVPDEVLRKPSPLAGAELTVMARHTEAGAEIVARMRGLRDLLPVVRNHHERLDGQGYPDRLAGEEIPLAARIVAVADAFDAMTSDRPYRPALSLGSAAEELRREAGGQFCPAVVAAFARLFERGEFTVATGERFSRLLSGEAEAE